MNGRLVWLNEQCDLQLENCSAYINLPFGLRAMCPSLFASRTFGFVSNSSEAAPFSAAE
jgi:hypothetical protein